jgi:hypothetical protein
VVILLPGWENSPGATAESSVARAIRKPSRAFEEFITVAPQDMFAYLAFDATKGLDQMV